MARKSKRQRKNDPPASRPPGLADWWRPGCLCLAIALLVATPLVPTERTELTGNALPYVMLWLVLALAWFAGAAWLHISLARLDWIDGLLVALAGWHVVSGLVMMYHGAPRLTINAMWSWVSFAVIAVLLRQLVRGASEAKAVCSAMMAIAVCLAVMAFYQAFITYPAQRATYERDKDAALERAGIHAPEGSALRKQFEARLYSSEPTATFSLTNSLAGYLAPWLVFAVGIAAVEGFGVQGSGFRIEEPGVRDREPTTRSFASVTWIGIVVTIFLLAFCLLLTKSRTAWLATLIGVAGVGAMVLWLCQLRKLLAVATCVNVGVVAVVVALGFAGMLPDRIISAAALSLKYRFEYWQSTAMMIRDYPLFGCGPGNFQHYYTAYKLPQASETIADPHNFVMELASVAGLPALVIFLVLLRWLFRKAIAPPATGSNTSPESKSQESGRTVSYSLFYAGYAVGVIIAIPLGLVTGYVVNWPALFSGGIAGGVVLWLLRDWVARGQLPRWLSPLAIAVLLINLLAAGGLSFPGVMMTLLVLIAVMTCGERIRGWLPSPLASLVGFVPVTLALLLTCHQTAYNPVLKRERILASAADPFVDPTDFYHQAAEADPWSAQPDLLLAQYESSWVFDEDIQRCEAHIQRMLTLDRRSSTMEATAGFLYFRILHAEPNDPAKYQQRAVDHFQRAIDLYPNDAMAHANLAMICQYFGMTERAKEAAARALEIDAKCPHEERKLANRFVFADIGVAKTDVRTGLTDRQSAEQWMRDIRSNEESTLKLWK